MRKAVSQNLWSPLYVFLHENGTRQEQQEPGARQVQTERAQTPSSGGFGKAKAATTPVTYGMTGWIWGWSSWARLGRLTTPQQAASGPSVWSGSCSSASIRWFKRNTWRRTHWMRGSARRFHWHSTQHDGGKHRECSVDKSSSTSKGWEHHLHLECAAGTWVLSCDGALVHPIIEVSIQNVHFQSFFFLDEEAIACLDQEEPE